MSGIDPFCATAGFTTRVLSHVLAHPPGQARGLCAGDQKYRLNNPRLDHHIRTFPAFQKVPAYEQQPTTFRGPDMLR